MQNGPIIHGINDCPATNTNHHHYEVHCDCSGWRLWCRQCGCDLSLQTILNEHHRLTVAQNYRIDMAIRLARLRGPNA